MRFQWKDHHFLWKKDVTQMRKSEIGNQKSGIPPSLISIWNKCFRLFCLHFLFERVWGEKGRICQCNLTTVERVLRSFFFFSRSIQTHRTVLKSWAWISLKHQDKESVGFSQASDLQMDVTGFCVSESLQNCFLFFYHAVAGNGIGGFRPTQNLILTYFSPRRLNQFR